MPRVRSVFSSESAKDVQLGTAGPPGRSMAGRDSAGRSAFTRVLQNSRTVARDTAADLLNVIFPSDCRLCGAPMTGLGAHRVCSVCIARVAPSQETLCTRCGDAIGFESARFAAALGSGECTLCRLAPPAFTRAVAFAAYDAELRELLHLLKFEGQRPLAEHVLGQWLASAILKLRNDAASDLIVIPVPLFAARQRTRGFNQATILASAALKNLRKLAPDWRLTLAPHVLERTKDTRMLFALAPHQRRASLRGAFRIADAAPIHNREVLLIDDIMTTGATARECARVLLRAGAAKVWVATVARALPERLTATLTAQTSTSDVAFWNPTTSTTTAAANTPLLHPDPGRRQTF